MVGYILGVLHTKLTEAYSQVFYEGGLLSKTRVSSLEAGFRFYSHLESREELSGNTGHAVPFLLSSVPLEFNNITKKVSYTHMALIFTTSAQGYLQITWSSGQQDVCLQSHGTVYFYIL